MNQNISKFKSKWSTKDIMVTVILAITIGLLNIPLTYGTTYLFTIPMIYPLIMGISYFPITLVAYIIRKPGAVLLAAFIIYSVGVPFTPYGVMMLGQIFVYGIPLEIVFLIGRYKHFESWFMIIAGIVVTLIEVGLYAVAVGLFNMDFSIQILVVIEGIISGAVLCGLLAKWIGDAVFKTGVIKKTIN